MTRANPGTDRFVDVDRHIKIQGWQNGHYWSSGLSARACTV